MNTPGKVIAKEGLREDLRDEARSDGRNDPRSIGTAALSSAATATLKAFAAHAHATTTSRTAKTVVVTGSDAANAQAAATIAGELKRDLMRVPLSSVLSTHIGETEKNLDRVFAAAAKADAILFFDEADALFGKRSDVKDSHDRFANVTVDALAQRIESHAGVAILATRAKPNLDEPFTRRLRSVAYVDLAH